MSTVAFRIGKDIAELQKENITAIGVAVATTELLFGMCDNMVDSDVVKSDFCSCSEFCTCMSTHV